jgi:hypothetical protein
VSLKCWSRLPLERSHTLVIASWRGSRLNTLITEGRTGSNPHAFVILFKRDVPEIETPQDDDPLFFDASGAGRVHDKLWTLFTRLCGAKAYMVLRCSSFCTF